jgi:hypothetical protein
MTNLGGVLILVKLLRLGGKVARGCPPLFGFFLGLSVGVSILGHCRLKRQLYFLFCKPDSLVLLYNSKGVIREPSSQRPECYVSRRGVELGTEYFIPVTIFFFR